MNPASIGKGFEQGGFARTVFTDEKGDAVVERHFFCTVQYFQFKGIGIPDGKFFRMDIDLFQINQSDPSLFCLACSIRSSRDKILGAVLFSNARLNSSWVNWAAR